VLVDWIVIDDPFSKSDFGLTIQFFHFNPNPKKSEFLQKKITFNDASFDNNNAKLLLKYKTLFDNKVVNW